MLSQFIPSCIRVFIYLLFCPGPIEEGDCEKFGVSLSQLKADNTVRNLKTNHWYKFNTISPSSQKEKELLVYARKPIFKLTRGIGYFFALYKQNR